MRIDIDRLEREDLVMFINACFACTGQSEFYAAADGQRLSIDFLHAYVHGNYRRLYALTLAAGINHFNQAQIIAHLLASGAPADPAARAEEGRLLAAALSRLPPQRVFRLIAHLRRARVNNRRTRAVIRAWLARRRDLAFDAVKYRGHLRGAARHLHIAFSRVSDNPELAPFLFETRTRTAAARGRRTRAPGKPWDTPIFDSFRRAHYAEEAIYELPYTVAEGFAARLGVSRRRFLERIQPRMTAGERRRLEQAARRDKARLDAADLAGMPLTRLTRYALSRPIADRLSERRTYEDALAASARRALARAPLALGRVAAVLDRSYSSRGSAAKPNHPLAVALGVHVLLAAAAREYRAFYTTPADDPLALVPRGQTDLAGPLVRALAWRPELVVIVSDGFENDPPGAVAEVVRVFRGRLDRERRTAIVHMNPVFDSERYAPRALAPDVPTVGLRDAEDLPTALGFARFAVGAARLADLEAYLLERARDLLALYDSRTETAEAADATAGETTEAIEAIEAGEAS